MSRVFELEMILRDKGLKIVINFSYSNRYLFFTPVAFCMCSKSVTRSQRWEKPWEENNFCILGIIHAASFSAARQYEAGGLRA